MEASFTQLARHMGLLIVRGSLGLTAASDLESQVELDISTTRLRVFADQKNEFPNMSQISSNITRGNYSHITSFVGVCLCMCACMCVYRCAYVCVCAYVKVCTHARVHAYVRACLCASMYALVCVFVCRR